MRVPIFLKLNAVVLPRCSTLTWSASGFFWDSRLGKTLRYGVHGLLLVLIALVVISMVLHGTRRPEVPNTSNKPIPSKLAPDPTNTIVAAHLFGIAPQMHAETVVTAAASITVDGIAAGSDPKNSIAVLTLNGQSGEFHVGQVLPDGETLTVINPDSVELADGSNVRRIAMATYGTPDSEGPAAYAALLHGIGLSSPVNGQQTALDALAKTSATVNAEQPLPAMPASALNTAPVSAAGIVHIPAQATPLEQLQALRAQLIHPR